MEQDKVPELEVFMERIERKLGASVYRKMVEQRDRNDYLESNCIGLVAYLFGLQPKNEFMTPHPMLEMLRKGGNLVAFRKKDGSMDVRESLNGANVCVYTAESADYHPTWISHAALFLGEFEGSNFEFGQFFPPHNSPKRDARPMAEKTPSKRFGVGGLPIYYYRLEPVV